MCFTVLATIATRNAIVLHKTHADRYAYLMNQHIFKEIQDTISQNSNFATGCDVLPRGVVSSHLGILDIVVPLGEARITYVSKAIIHF